MNSNKSRLESIIKRANDNIKNFDNITEEKIEFLKQKSFELSERFNKEKLGYDYIYRLISYLFVSKVEWKRYLSSNEKVILLILTIDPTFKMYKIYESECKIENIKERIIEEFGSYIYEIMIIEKKYIKKFDDIDKYIFNFEDIKKLELK